MLGKELENAGFNVKYCEADADVQVVKAATNIANDYSVTVIGDDNDLLALLLFHASTSLHNVYFTCEQKSNAKSAPKIWDINKSKRALGTDICDNILALHAITGCDTTSRIHSIGKGTVIQKFIKDDDFNKLVKEFNKDNNDRDFVMAVGEQILLKVLNGATKTLNDLRLSRYNKKLAESTVALLPEMLGPTSDAGMLHMLRAYYQLQEWKGNEPLDLEYWGWKKTEKYILPVPMTKAPAPANLLKIIRCGCKTGCKTGQCTCKKMGVKCTSICSGCNGVSCFNAEEITLES